MTSRMREIDEKLARINDLISKNNLNGICLSKAINFSWFTAGGNNRVVTGLEIGAAAIVILDGRIFLVAPKNEIKRFMEEQVPDLGFEPWTYEWYGSREQAIQRLVGDKKIATDIPMGGWPILGAELNQLRYSLTKEEILKVQELSEICSREIATTCVTFVPGQSEYEIQAELTRRLMSFGIKPAVLLVAADERTKYRHPVPTENRLRKYAIIGLVGEKGGLHTALTRSVYFGTLPDRIRRYYEVTLLVHQAFLENCKIGTDSRTVFEKGLKAYAAAGFPDEWKRHHQGGTVGYLPREYRAGEGQSVRLVANQILGWNPSVEATKSEETVLLTSDNNLRQLTSVPKWWPVMELSVQNSQLQFPLILER